MSKSKGNVIAPFDIFDTLGADALRWYFFSSGQPWTPRRVFPDGIREATRQSLLTLWNVHSFFTTYADLDGWEPAGREGGAHPRARPLDPLRARRHHRRGHRRPRGLRRPRRRQPPRAASSTTSRTGTSAAAGPGSGRRATPTPTPRSTSASSPWPQLLAPFCPFLADEIHTTLTGARSVHLTDWPEPQGRHDPALAEQMAAARRLVGARPRRPHRRQDEGPPAALAGRCCCTPAPTSTPTSTPRSAPS